VRAEATLDEEEPPAPRPREAHLSKLLDGRGHLSADLDPEGLELAVTALRLAESPDAEGEDRTPSHRRGDALVDIFRYFLDHQRGWSIELLPGAQVRVTEPSGRVHITDPPLLRSPLAA